jgi:hypothetical protein
MFTDGFISPHSSRLFGALETPMAKSKEWYESRAHLDDDFPSVPMSHHAYENACARDLPFDELFKSSQLVS